jgi:short-subunit dehydrogenase
VSGRRVLVIGASSGIGRATAHLLARQGARLVLASRSREVLEEVSRECIALGAEQVLVVPTDVGKREAVEDLFTAAQEEYGSLDAVVHSAGVVAYGRFHEVPADVFDHAVRTNFTGTANVARCALQQFEAGGGGSLVLLGSVLAKIATPTMSAYSSSKWGVQGLARTLEIEARQIPGVSVSLISPGSVNTPIYDLAGSYTGHPGHPPPPLTTPEKVAAACVAAIDDPRRDSNVGLANAVMVAGFRLMPPVFDRLVGPLMSVLGQARERVPPHPGNVIEPTPEQESVRGRWPHIWG